MAFWIMNNLLEAAAIGSARDSFLGFFSLFTYICELRLEFLLHIRLEFGPFFAGSFEKLL